MDKAETVLLLTRPDRQSQSFLSDLELRLGTRPPVIISPVLRIVPVGNFPDLDRYRSLIATSGNAVDVAGQALADRSVFTVGERTAEKARRIGADAECLGDRVDALLARILDVPAPALHLRGRHTRGDLAERGREQGVEIDEHVVYDQLEEPLTAEAQVLLRSGSCLLPLFSPRSASFVSTYDHHPETRVVAMSRAVAEAWADPKKVEIAAQPNRSAMIDLVAAAF